MQLFSCYFARASSFVPITFQSFRGQTKFLLARPERRAAIFPGISAFFSTCQYKRRSPELSHPWRTLQKWELIIHGWWRSVRVSAQGVLLRREWSVQGYVARIWGAGGRGKTEAAPSFFPLSTPRPSPLQTPEGINRAGMIRQNPSTP